MGSFGGLRDANGALSFDRPGPLCWVGVGADPPVLCLRWCRRLRGGFAWRRGRHWAASWSRGRRKRTRVCTPSPSPTPPARTRQSCSLRLWVSHVALFPVLLFFRDVRAWTGECRSQFGDWTGECRSQFGVWTVECRSQFGVWTVECRSQFGAWTVVALYFCVQLEPASPDVPNPPDNVRCTSVGEDSAVITWDAPSFDGGVPVKGTFEMRRIWSPTRNHLHLHPSSAVVTSCRLPDGEEEDGFVPVDQTQLRCVRVHHVRGQEDDRRRPLWNESLRRQRHRHLSAQRLFQALHAHRCVAACH